MTLIGSEWTANVSNSLILKDLDLAKIVIATDKDCQPRMSLKFHMARGLHMYRTHTVYVSKQDIMNGMDYV